MNYELIPRRLCSVTALPQMKQSQLTHHIITVTLILHRPSPQFLRSALCRVDKALHVRVCHAAPAVLPRGAGLRGPVTCESGRRVRCCAGVTCAADTREGDWLLSCCCQLTPGATGPRSPGDMRGGRQSPHADARRDPLTAACQVPVATWPTRSLTAAC